MSLILNPNKSALVTPYQIGGKAEKLGWLTRNGLNVPAWFVLTTQAFDQQLAPINDWIQQQLAILSNDSKQTQICAQAIQQKIKEMPLCIEIVDELNLFLKQWDHWQTCFFAVRSSISDEDSAEASFAGQMDSFLFQKGPEALQQSILKVFASAFSQRALAYRQQKNLTLTEIKAAVIIQEMIEGDISGVLFSAHPITGCRQNILVSACLGCGEGIVSGLCNTDEWTLDLTGQIIAEKINHKDIQLVFNQAEGIGLKQIDIAENQQNQACLSTQQLVLLAEVGNQIAQGLGMPQDIEWTIKNQQLYILQSRPITALPPPQQPKGEIQVWDNSNIQESYCGVTTPLTFSFANRAYATVYTQTMRAVGLSESVIEQHRNVLNNLLGLIQGRVYYNINNWYRGLCLLPSFKTNKADMERMMGLQDPVSFIEDKELNTFEKIKKLPAMIKALSRLLWQFKQLKHRVPAFQAHFKTVYNKINRKTLHQLEFAELMALTQYLDKQLLQSWTPPIINDFYVMMMNGKVHRNLVKAGFEHPESLQNRLLSGETEIESTQPTKVLLQLCAQIRQDKALQACFESTSNQHLLAVLQTQNPAFYQDCLAYIEAYGDRTMGELKLETISLRTEPAFMFAVLKNFLKREDLTLETLNKNEQALRQEAEKEAFAQIKKQSEFKNNLQKLRQAIKNRENMRFARTRLFGLYRDIYSEMGNQLAFYNVLKQGRDIFYLSVEELESYMQGRAIQTDLKALVKARKAEFKDYEKTEIPHHFKTTGAVYLHNKIEEPENQIITESNQTELTGTGCYPGIVENKIKLIFSPDDDLDLAGQILCTVRTDPGWAPLFPSAGGILVERGSTLSHSAVVARELGIPAIVGIPNLTQILKNGEKVRMDGTKGTIERQGEGHGMAS